MIILKIEDELENKVMYTCELYNKIITKDA